MDVQVVSTADYVHGTLQHAVALARAFALSGHPTKFVNVGSPALDGVQTTLRENNVDLVARGDSPLPASDLSIVVGVWQPAVVSAARSLATAGRRFVLVPTVYPQPPLIPSLDNRALALWYVSWDQALHDRESWSLAERVDVVRCAIDVEEYRPVETRLEGEPWILCRHSRDHPDKFSPETTLISYRLSATHHVVYRMLGATETLGFHRGGEVETWAEGSVEPSKFLKQAHLWVYSHADHWRETACIAMLEAMSTGIPVLVSDAGGMREYLRHGYAGFLCRSVDEFVAHARLLLDQPDTHCEMSCAARDLVVREYSLQRLAESLHARLRTL